MQIQRIGGGLLAAVAVAVPVIFSAAGFHLSQPVATWGLAGCAVLALIGVSLAVWPRRESPPPIPDMTIRELFFSIDADVLNDERKAWMAVGRDVLDALSIGRLTGWGRQIGRGSRQSRHRSTLQRIEQSHWSTGEFTYWFFDPNSAMLTHFIGKEGIGEHVEWADLRVNRAEARRIWPKLPSRSVASEP
jgi:hypothetical protein